MTNDDAKQIESDFSGAIGYKVEAKPHGVLVTEDAGRTSFFTDPSNFWRFVETLIDRLHPIPR